MNKMTGIILMLIGAIFLIAGYMTYKNAINEEVETTDQEIVKKEVQVITDTILIERETKGKTSIQKHSETTDLEHAIEMAIADGVLTNNERVAIRKIATDKSLDVETILLDVEQRLKKNGIKAETEIIDQEKKKGNDFEKYIVGKFDKRYFTLKEWAGDKYVKGTYAETTLHPDLVLEFNLKGDSRTFAVECKWRKNLFNNGVEFASKEQLFRYKKYALQKNMDVYVAVGVGGEASDPEFLSIIPVIEIDNTFLNLEMLRRYNKNTEKNFYFNIESGKLN